MQKHVARHRELGAPSTASASPTLRFAGLILLLLLPPIMNSYPPELLAQLAPVMFVAGLGAALPPTSPQGTRRSQDPFTILADRLKDALLAQRRLAVWQPDKSKTFQVVLVEPVRSNFVRPRCIFRMAVPIILPILQFYPVRACRCIQSHLISATE